MKRTRSVMLVATEATFLLGSHIIQNRRSFTQIAEECIPPEVFVLERITRTTFHAS